MILVTGSNGFLGSAVVRRLVETGQGPIRCLVRPGSSTARLDDLVEAEAIEIHRGTLNSKFDCFTATEGVDTIYHLAAGMGGGAMADVWLTTVVATDTLMQALDKRLTDGSPIRRVVHCSSFAVYGTGSLPSGATVDESTPLETNRAEADDYSHAKLRQEEVVRDAAALQHFELVVVRPGVVYGPGGSGLSRRIGIRQGDVMVAMGGNNLLPLSYVTNCAEAMVLLGSHDETAGQTFNIHDDDLVTAKQFLAQYRQEAEKLRVVALPKPVTKLLAGGVEWYHNRSRGQMPAAITRHLYRTVWAGNTFDNSRLKALGWTQTVPTEEGMRRYFESVAEARDGASEGGR